MMSNGPFEMKKGKEGEKRGGGDRGRGESSTWSEIKVWL